MCRSWRLVGMVLVGLALTVVVGCGKLSKDNYDKINVGMTLADVEKILGKGTEKAGAAGAVANIAGSAKVMTWGDDKKSITITFANDKVVTKTQQGL
jgi:hypothetical protein